MLAKFILLLFAFQFSLADDHQPILSILLQAHWSEFAADFESTFEIATSLKSGLPFESDLLALKVVEFYQLHDKATSVDKSLWSDAERIKFVALMNEFEPIFGYDDESDFKKFVAEIASRDLLAVLLEIWEIVETSGSVISQSIIELVAQKNKFPRQLLFLRLAQLLAWRDRLILGGVVYWNNGDSKALNSLVSQIGDIFTTTDKNSRLAKLIKNLARFELSGWLRGSLRSFTSTVIWRVKTLLACTLAISNPFMIWKTSSL